MSTKGKENLEGLYATRCPHCDAEHRKHWDESLNRIVVKRATRKTLKLFGLPTERANDKIS